MQSVVPFLPKTWHRLVFAAVLGLAAFAWLAWQCERNPAITFLPTDSRAEWILFPAVRSFPPYEGGALDTVFRRKFTLTAQPQTSRLEVRAAKHFKISLNGRDLSLTRVANWKEITEAEVANCLHPGTNTIEATVTDADGPAALWLSLNTGELSLRSDGNWDVSEADSSWRGAALSSQPAMPGLGNPQAGGEGSFGALTAIWPIWTVFGVGVLLICVAGNWWLRKFPASERGRPVWVLAPVPAMAGVFAILCLHNLAEYHSLTGYDSPEHLEYIRYLGTEHSLPWPDQGWEMYQPPLYYAFSAFAIKTLGHTVDSVPGLTVLRVIGLLTGLGELALIFLSLRLLCPERRGSLLVGVALAAFLPMHLCLVNDVTNETTVALLVAAAVYLGLRILKIDDQRWWSSLVLGAVLGAALLAKVTALLAALVIIASFCLRPPGVKASAMTFLRTGGMVAVGALVVCGWFYARIWHHYGTPLVGNWDAFLGFHWWQDPGFHTAADYARFGRSLTHPFFSAYAGVADGIYSTLWGDGLYSGANPLVGRPPWNYNLMAAGYLLALAPALVLLSGLVAALLRFFRRPTAELFVLLGLPAAVGFGMVYMSLKVPSYAQAKAFYGLCLLVPLGFFGAVGWEVLTRGRRLRQYVLGVVLLVWLMNCVAAMWIRGGSAELRFFAEKQKGPGGNPVEKMAELRAVLEMEPADAAARRELSVVLDAAGQSQEAMAQAERAVQDSPADALCHLQVGILLAERGQGEGAVNEGRRAEALGPECVEVYRKLPDWLGALGRKEEAVAAARDGLAVAPHDPGLHDLLGTRLFALGDKSGAEAHFGMALIAQSDFGPAEFHFGQLLEQEGKFAQAVPVLVALSRQNPADAEARLLLGMAQAGAGDAAGASENLRAAVKLAPDSPTILGEVAWVLATNPDARLRDGQEAVRLAEHACAIVKEKNARLQGTLAAAYAEAGRFGDAITTAQQAVATAQSTGDRQSLALCQELLAAFQSGRKVAMPAAP